MTSTLLSRLLASELIRPGDTLTFKFKRNRFTAKVDAGGLLTASAMDGQPLPGVFKDLQTWCDECICEHGGEYVQRFSSAKRVKQERTQRTIAQLKERMNPDANAPCQCAEALAQRRRVLELETRVQELERLIGDPPEMDVDTDNPFVLKF